MTTSTIFLIIISGLGVVHGLFLALFLWTYQKGNTKSNKILSLLLITLSFRVGKSVIREFAQVLDIKLILIGLATLMAIGPLYYLYVLSYTDKQFQFRKKHLLHFIPALIGIAFGFWINDPSLDAFPKLFILFLFFTYYGHYLAYIISTFSVLRKKKLELNYKQYALLRLLFYALLAIWLVYVLNLFDEFIPYIIGPILYTVVAYVVSFIIIKKGYIEANSKAKYTTTPVSEEQVNLLFSKVAQLVIDNKQFKDPDLSLKSLSAKLNVSPQRLSLAVNKKSQTNFNRFINHHRVEESIRLFHDKQYDNHTIAAIAFEVGFNSISSFNTAFKTQTGKTPLKFRKELSK